MIDKDNNFDLIRIFVTIQVIFHHFYGHLNPHFGGSVGTFIYNSYKFFPSLPIFFLISGFLVSMSLERSHSIGHYFINRILKLYPALWGFFFISLICITMTGYWHTCDVSFGSILIWLLAQLSFLQVYNPDFLRNFGVGALNGSLWTLTAEIQFYLLLPIIYLFFKNKSKIWGNIFLAFLIILFSFISIKYSPSISRPIGLLGKFYKTSCIPYLYMLLIGIFIQRNFLFFKKIIEDKALLWLAIYSFAFFMLGGIHAEKTIYMCSANIQTILLFIFLAFTVFSFALSFKTLSRTLLKGYDITYGSYIYHMLFINLFVEYSFPGNLSSLMMIYFLTFGAAFFSWVYIERPALRLKKYTLKKAETEKIKQQFPTVIEAVK